MGHRDRRTVMMTESEYLQALEEAIMSTPVHARNANFDPCDLRHYVMRTEAGSEDGAKVVACLDTAESEYWADEIKSSETDMIHGRKCDGIGCTNEATEEHERPTGEMYHSCGVHHDTICIWTRSEWNESEADSRAARHYDHQPMGEE
jgi:hypothetical protein